jgi:hypothetical protein
VKLESVSFSVFLLLMLMILCGTRHSDSIIEVFYSYRRYLIVNVKKNFLKQNLSVLRTCEGRSNHTSKTAKIKFVSTRNNNILHVTLRFHLCSIVEKLLSSVNNIGLLPSSRCRCNCIGDAVVCSPMKSLMKQKMLIEID